MTKPINKEECKNCKKLRDNKVTNLCADCHSNPTELSGILDEFDKEFPITGSDKYGFFITVNPQRVIDFITKTYTTALAKGQAGERERIRGLVKNRRTSSYGDNLIWKDELLKELSDISSGLGGGE